MKIAILGAGHGGLAMACDLAANGYEVHLAALPEHPGCIPQIMDLDTIELQGVTGTGAAPGKVKILMITTDVVAAIKGVDIIMVVIPAFGQVAYMEILTKHAEAGQLIVLNPGKFGSLIFSRMLKEAGRENELLIGETVSLLYAAKIQQPGVVKIKAVKDKLLFATLPGSRTAEALRRIQPFFPQFQPARNVLETSIADPGFIVHTASTLMNASRVEQLGSYATANYDITPAQGRVMEAMDAERIAIAMKLGVSTLSLQEAAAQMYGVGGHTFYEIEMNITAHRNQKAPSSLEHRYITEEVPYALVPLMEIARILELKTPTFAAITTLATHANDEYYLVTGRNATQMGIGAMSPEELMDYVS